MKLKMPLHYPYVVFDFPEERTSPRNLTSPKEYHTNPHEDLNDSWIQTRKPDNGILNLKL